MDEEQKHVHVVEDCHCLCHVIKKLFTLLVPERVQRRSETEKSEENHTEQRSEEKPALLIVDKIPRTGARLLGEKPKAKMVHVKTIAEMKMINSMTLQVSQKAISRDLQYCLGEVCRSAK